MNSGKRQCRWGSPLTGATVALVADLILVVWATARDLPRMNQANFVRFSAADPDGRINIVALLSLSTLPTFLVPTSTCSCRRPRTCSGCPALILSKPSWNETPKRNAMLRYIFCRFRPAIRTDKDEEDAPSSTLISTPRNDSFLANVLSRIDFLLRYSRELQDCAGDCQMRSAYHSESLKRKVCWSFCGILLIRAVLPSYQKSGSRYVNNN